MTFTVYVAIVNTSLVVIVKCIDLQKINPLHFGDSSQTPAHLRCSCEQPNVWGER